MDDLVQWLRAQLKEDERIAKEAGNRRWLVQDNIIELYPEREDDGFMSWPTRSDARHAANWDPARVLREIDAKRQLLDDYTVTARIRDEAAERIKAAGDHPDSKNLETWDRAQREAAILEGPVRLAALPLSDRPGYREEWRP